MKKKKFNHNEFFCGLMDYWNIPKWGVFFLVAKNCHLATKKGGGGLPLAKNHFLRIKKAYHILKGGKKKRVEFTIFRP